MTGHELRDTRRRLGLTVQWCAVNDGHVSRRTWQFWEAGRNGQSVRVPEDVVKRMDALDRVMSGVLYDA